MAKMRWKNIISRSQIDRKKFVFNVISGEKRGSSGLLGWLRDREEKAMKTDCGGWGREDEKTTPLLCVYVYFEILS
jgi:hypothetical protein